MSKTDQPTLTGIEPEPSWEDEWHNMPEYIQEQQEPYQTIKVRFRSEKDVQDFAILMDQPITPQTKSMWHPALIRGLNSNKRYEDES